MEEKEERVIRRISIGILSIILLIGAGVIIFLLMAVIPIFVQMFAEINIILPLPTRIMIEMSNGLRHYCFFVLPFIVLIFILAIWGTKKIFKRLPIWLPILLIPVFMVLMGLLIGLIVIAMYLPLFVDCLVK